MKTEFQNDYHASVIIRSLMLELTYNGFGKEADEGYKILAHANNHLMSKYKIK